MRSEDYNSCFVILSVSLSVCLSVTTFSAATSNKTANKRYEWVQCHTGFIFKNSLFCKNVAFESYGVKQKYHPINFVLLVHFASQPYFSSCACALGRGAGEGKEKYVW